MHKIMYVYHANKINYNILNTNHSNLTIHNGGGKKHQDREIEWRWINNVNIDEVRGKLTELNADLICPKMIMPLMVFEHPNKKQDSYIRIRHEGTHITLTSKTDLKSKYVKESEVIIDNFEQGVKILVSLGCKLRYYVEKLRETWKLPGIKEIVIDSYPGTREYIEIDALSEKDLIKTTKMLGLEPPTFPLKGADDIYLEDYGIPMKRDLANVFTFANGYKIDKKYITKNAKMFKQYLKEQQKYYDDLNFDPTKIIEYVIESNDQ